MIWPQQDLPFVPKYLVTFTVGFDQKDVVNEAVSKVNFPNLHSFIENLCLSNSSLSYWFLVTLMNSLWFFNGAFIQFSKNWTIVLFHYDGRIDEWDQFEWAQTAIHISARKQSKWYYASSCICFWFLFVQTPMEYSADFDSIYYSIILMKYLYFHSESAGGLQRDFSILMSWHLSSMYLFGMRIWVSSTSTVRSMYLNKITLFK